MVLIIGPILAFDHFLTNYFRGESVVRALKCIRYDSQREKKLRMSFVVSSAKGLAG